MVGDLYELKEIPGPVSSTGPRGLRDRLRRVPAHTGGQPGDAANSATTWTTISANARTTGPSSFAPAAAF